MKTIIKTTEQLAKNIYKIAKSFAEVYNENCTTYEQIIRDLSFYYKYCKVNGRGYFYVRISTIDGFVLCNTEDIYDNGLLCKVFVFDKEIRVIYKTK